LYLGVSSGAMAAVGLCIGTLMLRARGGRLRMPELGAGLALASVLLLWF
jgi:hypothetical protein